MGASAALEARLLVDVACSADYLAVDDVHFSVSLSSSTVEAAELMRELIAESERLGVHASAQSSPWFTNLAQNK
jgi:hypothetical protein